MIHISEIKTSAPEHFNSDVQEMVYNALAELDITFERVDTDSAVTMDDCRAIDEKLDMNTVKTLFLCNRRKTVFYLFVTCGNKPFVTTEFCRALGVARVSFAPAELLADMLHTPVGGASVLSAVIDTGNRVQVVIDSDVLKEKWLGCNDGTPTSYLKIETDLVINRYLPHTNHHPAIITL